MSTSLICPVVSLVSSGDDLADTYLRVRSQVLGLIRAIEEASPNGRDYYPGGPDLIKVACAEHATITGALNRIAQDFLTIATPAEERDGGDCAYILDALVFDGESKAHPIVHLNGTGAQTLREQFKALYRSANALVEALQQLAPNGRDFHAEEWAIAREQHFARVQCVKNIAGYYMVRAMRIYGALQH